MPNIFKRFSLWAKAEPYQFPDAQELKDEEEEAPAGVSLPEETDGPETAWEAQDAPAEEPGRQEPEADGEPEGKPEENPVKFAQIQANALLEDARREAEDILAKARLDAEVEAEQIRAIAQEDGRQAGYADGLAQGRLEASQELEKLAAAQEEEVQRFLDRAGAELDRRMDESVEDLRDLAMAIAEKVVGISLKSSSDVICRMIQNAIDKKKRREWVHIYISDSDAKRLGQIPASLSAALTALSGRVRLIPIAGDEPGTCIIETPDEIIDASAATQLNNIRSLLMDAPSDGTGGGFF